MWRCKKCNSVNTIYAIEYGKCKMQYTQFNKDGDGINGEVIDFEGIDRDEYTCAKCNSSASDIENIADWEE